jgi:hypothetical protein
VDANITRWVRAVAIMPAGRDYRENPSECFSATRFLKRKKFKIGIHGFTRIEHSAGVARVANEEKISNTKHTKGTKKRQ